MARYPDEQQYKEIAEKLNKKFNIKVEAEKSALREAVIENDYQIEFKDEVYNVYLNTIFAKMHKLRDVDKPPASSKAYKI